MHVIILVAVAWAMLTGTGVAQEGSKALRLEIYQHAVRPCLQAMFLHYHDSGMSDEEIMRLDTTREIVRMVFEKTYEELDAMEALRERPPTFEQKILLYTQVAEACSERVREARHQHLRAEREARERQQIEQELKLFESQD